MRLKIQALVAVMSLVTACGRVGFAQCDDAPCTDELDVIGPDGLIARYAMDDNPAKGTVTAVPRKYSAQCGAMCPSATEGVRGGGYEFSRDIRFALPANILARNSAYTISIWLKLPSLPTPMSPLTKIIHVQSYNAVSLRIDPGMVSYEGTTSNAGSMSVSSCLASVNVADGQWHQVAMTWNQSNRVLFIDGKAERVALEPLEDSDEPFGIGGDVDGDVQVLFFRGALDDLRFYNRALSASEVAALFNAR
jgi:Concanavalin A-like lectin/glucanases superfamily